MSIFKNFRNEMSWDGILAIAAIVGMVGTATLYAVETRATANDAAKAATAAAVEADKAQVAAVLASQKAHDEQELNNEKYNHHFDQLDSAIQLLTAIVNMHNGMPVKPPALDDSYDPQSSNASPPATNDP